MQPIQSIELAPGIPSQALAGGFWLGASASLDAPGGGHRPFDHDLGDNKSQAGEREYRPALTAVELIAEVKRLLDSERRIERLVCRYLADLADRIRQRQDDELYLYVDEFHAAPCCFGLGVRDTRERVRIGRALRQLPQLETVFVTGELSYSRVREVTRVAEPHTEQDWIELARKVDMRTLERRVAAARGSTLETSDGAADDRAQLPKDKPVQTTPMQTTWLSQNRLRATFELSAEAWALLERALEGARRAGAASMTDAEALAAVARAALSAQAQSPGAPEQDWLLIDTSLVGPGASPAVPLQDSPPNLTSVASEVETANDIGSGATQGGSPRDPAALLLRIMGRRGGWSMDALVEKSGLSASEVSAALTVLEIEGRVRYRDFVFDPV